MTSKKGGRIKVDGEKNGLESEIRRMEERIKELDRELTYRDARIRNLEKDAAQKEETLSAIYRSNFWKLASRYYRMRDGVPVLKGAYRLLKSGRLPAVDPKSLKKAVKRAGGIRITREDVSEAGALPGKAWRYARRHGFKAALKKGRARIKDRLAVILAGAGGESGQARSAATTGLTGGVEDLVSVVLPVYNQASMLGESIESVLNQTYRNLELIIVNDGSSDEIGAVFRKYAGDPRVVLLTQKNQKLPAALNNGFRHARGEFCSWTSADNIMLPNQLETLVWHLKEHPAEAMVFSDYYAIDDRGAPLSDPDWRRHNRPETDRSVVRLPDRVTVANLHDSGDNYVGASFVYRRDAAWMTGDYANDTFGGEDYDYWLRLHNLFEIGHVRDLLYKYRVHDNTLNARAAELGLFDNIARLLRRDADRRAFLSAPVRFEQIGTAFDLPPGEEGVRVLVFGHSVRSSARVREALSSGEGLYVCVIDQDGPAALDMALLRKCDMLVTRSAAVFSALKEEFRNRVFMMDVAQNAELFGRVARNRLFDKTRVPQKPSVPAVPWTDGRRTVAVQLPTFDRGGLEKVVHNLIRSLDGERFRVVILLAEVERDAGDLGQFGSLSRREGWTVVPLGAGDDALEAAIREHRIEIVNLHYSLFGLDVYRRLGVETVYTVHNNYVWLSKEDRASRARAYKNVDHFIAVSTQVGQYFSSVFGVPPSSITTIPNGFDPSDFKETEEVTRESLGLSKDDYVFLNLASIFKAKCHNVMISAMKRLRAAHPEVKVLFVGNKSPDDADYYEQIAMRIRQERLEDCVRMLDYMPAKKIGGLLKAIDCLLLPSVTEGWSNVVMEAMHAGKPLILSDVGSARDVIEESDIGIIVPRPHPTLETMRWSDLVNLAYYHEPPNTAAVAEAMAEMCSNRALWAEKGEAGRRKVVERYSVEEMAGRYGEIYDALYAGILGRAPGPSPSEKHMNRIVRASEGRPIFAFRPVIDWNVPIFQRPQQIALELAKAGGLYFFCTPKWEHDRITDRFQNLGPGCWLTDRYDAVLSLPDGKIHHLYSTDIKLRFDFVKAELAKGNGILYEYIDEIHGDIPGCEIPRGFLNAHERILGDERCLVVASADRLYADVAKRRSKNFVMATNGVDYAHFSRKFKRSEVPPEIAPLVETGRPIIGYHGSLAKWFDFDAVSALAEARPEYQILLIGYVYGDDRGIERMKRHPNVFFPGPVDYKALPRHAFWYDVATIPFVRNDITASTSPIKLFEYMAMGKPIVTSDMPECRKYKSVMVARDHGEFIRLVDKALGMRDDRDYMALLDREARENTWEAKAGTIMELVRRGGDWRRK